MEEIIISNPNFEDIKNRIKKEGVDKIQVLADFDRTLKVIIFLSFRSLFSKKNRDLLDFLLWCLFLNGRNTGTLDC